MAATGIEVTPNLDPATDLEAALARLDGRLRELDSVLVAFSGGTDSAFLLAAAVQTLGPAEVVAATAVSPSLASTELAAAEAFCASLGVRHVAPSTHELERTGYRQNAGDRCYFCKAELLDVLGPLAERHGLATVVTGTNADDAAAGFRPGIRAARERGAATPLLDAGLGKAQIRAASRAWGLSTWDKPAAACLSSRVAFGVEVTSWRLVRVDRAEAQLRTVLTSAGLDVINLRVRDLGERVRVELDADALRRLTTQPVLAVAVTAVRAAGFATPIDWEQFRSGSMNELLADPERYR